MDIKRGFLHIRSDLEYSGGFPEKGICGMSISWRPKSPGKLEAPGVSWFFFSEMALVPANRIFGLSFHRVFD